MSAYLINLDNINLSAKLDRIFANNFHPLPGDNESEKISQGEKETLDFLNKSISLQDGRYQVAVPWRFSKRETMDIMNSIDSGSIARKRLEGLGRRMQRDSNLKEKVFLQMENLENKQYVEKVPISELNNPGRWYLPLHPVTYPRKPGKVRLTHDGSSRSGGFSLNDFLLKGPDSVCKLVSVLLRARIHSIIVKCDIQEFFMRIKMAPDDRDAFRFYFWTGRDQSQVVEWRTLVWLFGLLSSPCVATLALHRCSDDYGNDYHEEVKETIEKSIYVDDCFRSVPDVQCALKLLSDLPQMLAKGGFKLAKMVSNNASVMQHIKEEDRVAGVVSFHDKVVGEDLALGMKLDLSTDSFKPAFDKDILVKNVQTRRDVLSVVAAIWLPLGIFLPFVVPAKVIVQRLASLKLAWDDVVPPEELKLFNEWRAGLESIEKYEVPRWIKWKPGQIAQVHIFSDASIQLYGACGYLCTVDEEGNVFVTLLMAKA